MFSPPLHAADEVLTTTRAVRRRLDLERPVPQDLLLECLRIAVQAPSGSNRQGWHFLLVSDPERKQAIAELYRLEREVYTRALEDPSAPAERSAQHLTDHLHEVPWILVPVLEGRPDGTGVKRQASFWGSILPAFWSFMLAARSRGLGTAWITLQLEYEREMAGILGIPYERFTQAGLSPVAYFTGTGFRPARRLPLESVVHWEHW